MKDIHASTLDKNYSMVLHITNNMPCCAVIWLSWSLPPHTISMRICWANLEKSEFLYVGFYCIYGDVHVQQNNNIRGMQAVQGTNTFFVKISLPRNLHLIAWNVPHITPCSGTKDGPALMYVLQTVPPPWSSLTHSHPYVGPTYTMVPPSYRQKKINTDQLTVDENSLG